MITKEESKILDLLAEASNQYISLSQEWRDGGGCNDRADFYFFMRQLQNLVSARVGYRSLRGLENIAQFNIEQKAKQAAFVRE